MCWNTLPALVTLPHCLRGRDETHAVARSVLARPERSGKWLIISTPQSGWFRCSGERGTGIALLLGLARWLGRQNDGPSCLFMTNPGHEIGHIGMKHVLDHVPLPRPSETLCWLHVGSCVATREWREVGPTLVPSGYEQESWLFGSDDLLPLLKEHFVSLPHLEPKTYNLKRGEIRWILERGYSGFALMGPQRHFHLVDDGPEGTSPDLLGPVALTVARTLDAILATRPPLPQP